MTAPQRSSGFDTRAILHQLGQPLSAILSNAQAARRFLSSDTPDLAEAKAALSDIVTQSKQAAKIFRRLEAHLLSAGAESRE
jgi:C4-dicarboxylate-specific signal transduction histidine kinase